MATASAPIAIALAKSEDTRSPPVMTRSISAPASSRYFLARERAYTVGTLVESLTSFGLAPVAPPLPSMVIKSGSAKTQYSKSFSIFPAAIFIPMGRPSDAMRSWATKSLKSSLLRISSNLDGLITSSPRGLFRIAAISGVTLAPGRWPPIPGFVPCPILISIASDSRRLSGVTLYRFGTYSKMYLYAALFSSGRIPPSPLHMAVPAMALPFAKATFISFDIAPKDMCDM